jgi:hypothetical protein
MSQPPPLFAESLQDLASIAETAYCVPEAEITDAADSGSDDTTRCTVFCTILCLPIKLPLLLCCLPSAIHGSCCRRQAQDPHELRF